MSLIRAGAFLLASLSFAQWAPSMPSIQGEALPPLRVNGVLFQITRLVDGDMERRLKSIERDWRRSGGEVQAWRDVGSWRVLARRQGRWSETLQVRTDGGAREVYLSRMDLEQRPGPLPPLTVPPGCRAHSIVESPGNDSVIVQASGPCKARSPAEGASWALRLAAEGWRGAELDGSGVWRFQRGADLLQVVRTPTGFTVLQTTSRGLEP